VRPPPAEKTIGGEEQHGSNSAHARGNKVALRIVVYARRRTDYCSLLRDDPATAPCTTDQRLVSGMTGLHLGRLGVQLLIRGTCIGVCNGELRQRLLACVLVAPSKKDGGVRPVAPPPT